MRTYARLLTMLLLCNVHKPVAIILCDNANMQMHIKHTSRSVIFSERDYVTVAICRLSSDVCRLSVTLVRPTQPVEIFRSFFIKRQRIRALRYVCYMRSQFRLSSVVCRLAVCLSSVTLVHPIQAVELFGNFFSPYDSPGTLLFWCQKSLVGDAPFPLKFAFKVTHPLSNSEILTNIGS